ncbi:hypothetical protein FO519_009089 [Halicephalobus sp. NKZ332]|nr:hypothetical protein FO519_009089 [Halicephalobus sp. NKZ332]
MKAHFLLIFLFFINESVNAETTVMASGIEAPEGAFWLTTELVSLTFTPECLSTKYCVQPVFRITQSMATVPESHSMSWPITENLTKDGREHTFVTFWTSGEPKMVSFVAQVTGKDPSFGFSRDCDKTPESKVFQLDNAYFRSTMGLRARRHLGNDHRKPAQVADAPVEVTLLGSCFNATFAIRRHLERCPWCPDRNLHVSLSGNENSEENDMWTENMTTLMADNRIFYSLLILCFSFLMTIAAITICICTFTPCCAQKRIRRPKQKPLNMNLYHQRSLPPSHPMKQTVELLKRPPPKIDDDEHHYQMPMIPVNNPEHRYETPWDRKYRPIQQYWNGSISHKSEMTVTSPVDSSSALGSMSDRTTFAGGNSGCSLPGMSQYSTSSIHNTSGHGMINIDGTVRIPPNFNSTSPISSSGSQRHDDSGLESV